ncbi:MAG TPA: hypothetical protein VGJ20_35145 [Xanthobacteraceae bacterium]|jgi:hypothetical protein
MHASLLLLAGLGGCVIGLTMGGIVVPAFTHWVADKLNAWTELGSRRTLWGE